MKINTMQAFRSINLDHLSMQRLAQNPKTQNLIRAFGIDPGIFTPTIAPEISAEEWIRVLRFYAEKAGYQPARDILTNLKRIIKG